jgi:hypothetical protein
MNRPLFLPSPRQAAWLAAIALLSLACALYLRYQAVEQSAVGIACETAPGTWRCTGRKIAIVFHTSGVFGIVAVGAALLNLLRPSFVLWAVALTAGGFGIVLYNAGLSALAGAFLILSLARPAPEPE